MGVFYGLAKGRDYMGDRSLSKFYSFLSVAVPVLLHGTYDYIASMGSCYDLSWIFIIFVLILFSVSIFLVNQMAKNDRYISRNMRRS